MTIDDAPAERPAPVVDRWSTILAAALSALWRAAMAFAAVALLIFGLALTWWSLTPTSDAAISDALRGGMTALAAAHFLPISLGGVALTLRPLFLTAIVLGVLATALGRSRTGRGATAELVHGAVFSIAYALLVTAATVGLALPGTARVGFGPFGVALVGSAIAVASRPEVVRAVALPAWVRVGVRSGALAAAMLVVGAALALAAAMVMSFPAAMRMVDASVHGAADAVALAAVGIAFAPNAVMAAVGYVTGAGFTVGSGIYGPLAVHGTDLPALPVLTAVPSSPGGLGYATLAVPVVAALAAAVMVLRRVPGRGERLAACVVAAVTAGLAIVILAASAGGGVAGGPWPTSGAPALLTGALVAAVVLLVGGSIAGAAEARHYLRNRPKQSSGNRRSRRRNQGVATPAANVDLEPTGAELEPEPPVVDAELEPTGTEPEPEPAVVEGADISADGATEDEIAEDLTDGGGDPEPVPGEAGGDDETGES